MRRKREGNVCVYNIQFIDRLCVRVRCAHWPNQKYEVDLYSFRTQSAHASANRSVYIEDWSKQFRWLHEIIAWTFALHIDYTEFKGLSGPSWAERLQTSQNFNRNRMQASESPMDVRCWICSCIADAVRDIQNCAKVQGMNIIRCSLQCIGRMAKQVQIMDASAAHIYFSFLSFSRWMIDNKFY